jgi:hypothetical protein
MTATKEGYLMLYHLVASSISCQSRSIIYEYIYYPLFRRIQYHIPRENESYSRVHTVCFRRTGIIRANGNATNELRRPLNFAYIYCIACVHSCTVYCLWEYTWEYACAWHTKFFARVNIWRNLQYKIIWRNLQYKIIYPTYLVCPLQPPKMRRVRMWPQISKRCPG